jgi:hypothetical protein
LLDPIFILKEPMLQYSFFWVTDALEIDIGQGRSTPRFCIFKKQTTHLTKNYPALWD